MEGIVEALAVAGSVVGLAVVLTLPLLVAVAAAGRGGSTKTLKIAIGVLCAAVGLLLLLAATEEVSPSEPGSSTHGLVFVFLPIWCAVGVGVLGLSHLIGRAVGEWIRKTGW